MKKVNCLILSLSILLLASYSAAFCEIPKQVYKESIIAHRFWYGLRESNVSQDEKAQLNVETLVSSPWQPYELYIVSAENLQKCKSGDDILSLKEFLCYRCPIIANNSIVGFSTVKRVLDKESNNEIWKMTGQGPGAEREAEYYTILKQYPAEEGYSLQAISFDWKSKRFYILVTPEKEYMILPASKTSINFLILLTGERPEDDFVPLDQVLSVFHRYFKTKPK